MIFKARLITRPIIIIFTLNSFTQIFRYNLRLSIMSRVDETLFRSKENFVLAEKREAILADLTPGSEEWYLFNLVQFVHTGKLDEKIREDII